MSIGERFSEPLALGLEESEVMVEMLDVFLDIAAHGDDACAVVRALAQERVVGQEPEHARPLSPADFEECQCVFEGLLVVKEPLDVGCFVGVEQRRIVFGEDALHPVDGDGVAVGQVDDQLLNRPVAGPGSSESGFAREPLDSVPELLAPGGVGFDQVAVHGCSSYVVLVRAESIGPRFADTTGDQRFGGRLRKAGRTLSMESGLSEGTWA